MVNGGLYGKQRLVCSRPRVSALITTSAIR